MCFFLPAPQLLYVYDGVEIGHDLDYQSDNYALGLNYAIKGGMKDVVSLKWGISSAAKCTLDDREADVTGMMSLGDSPSIQTSGLGLKVIILSVPVTKFVYYCQRLSLNPFGPSKFINIHLLFTTSTQHRLFCCENLEINHKLHVVQYEKLNSSKLFKRKVWIPFRRI